MATTTNKGQELSSKLDNNQLVRLNAATTRKIVESVCALLDGLSFNDAHNVLDQSRSKVNDQSKFIFSSVPSHIEQQLENT